MATLTSYEGSNDDYENGGDANALKYRAQGFQFQTDDASITGCSIYGSRGSQASGTFKVVLSTSLGGAELATTGNLTTTSALSAYGSPDWNDLTFTTPYSATKDTQYYLTLVCLTGSDSDEVRWSRDGTSPTYAYGSRSYSSDGSSWTTEPSVDTNFRVYGTTAAADLAPSASDSSTVGESAQIAQADTINRTPQFIAELVIH